MVCVQGTVIASWYVSHDSSLWGSTVVVNSGQRIVRTIFAMLTSHFVVTGEDRDR